MRLNACDVEYFHVAFEFCVCVCVVCLCNDDIPAFVEGIEMYTFGPYLDDAVKGSGSSRMFFLNGMTRRREIFLCRDINYYYHSCC